MLFSNSGGCCVMMFFSISFCSSIYFRSRILECAPVLFALTCNASIRGILKTRVYILILYQYMLLRFLSLPEVAVLFWNTATKPILFPMFFNHLRKLLCCFYVALYVFLWLSIFGHVYCSKWLPYLGHNFL